MTSYTKDAAIFTAGLALGGSIVWLTLREKKRQNEISDHHKVADGYDAEVELSSLGEASHSLCDGPAAASRGPLDFEHDEVVAEQLTRNVQFFGTEGQKKISEAFVVVVGLGVSMPAPTPHPDGHFQHPLPGTHWSDPHLELACRAWVATRRICSYAVE